MPYVYVQNEEWKKGDVISSARLNNLENGIRKALEDINNLDISNDQPTENDDTDHFINGFARDSTLASLTQTDGLIGATFQTIEICSAQINDRADGIDGNGNEANKVVKTNGSGIIPSQLLPSYVDDVIEIEGYNNFPGLDNNGEPIGSSVTDNDPDDAHAPSGPEIGKIYVDTLTGRSYRWSGSRYVEIGVIHLNYKDDNDEANNNQINGGTTASSVTFGATDAKYVKKVTQADGQIKVEHALFNPTINTTSSTGTSGDLFSITIGGNTSNTFTPTLASTAVYGATKLNHDTVSSTETNNSVTIHTFSDNDTLAITSLGLKNAFNTLNSTVTAPSTAFVNGIEENNGVVTITTINFSPTINNTTSTSVDAQKFSFTVGGSNTSNTYTLDKATTEVYGVTKLSDTQDPTISTVAATPKGVWDAINTLDYTNNNGGTLKTPTNITQTDGKIAVTYENIQTATTGVYGVTQLSSTQSTSEESYAATPKGVWAAINTLNNTVTATNGYVTSITQTNGAISGTTAEFSYADSDTAGLIKVGTNLNIDNNGVLSATDTTYGTATTVTEGLMSSTDKAQLDVLTTATTFNASGDILGIKIYNTDRTQYKWLTFDGLSEAINVEGE